MKKMIKLRNPIKVDGKLVKELPFDTDCYTMDEHKRANKKFLDQYQGGMFLQETTPEYHLIVARILIEKSSGGSIMYEDLERLKGVDIFAVQGEGRSFLLGSEETSENSEEQSETIAELSPEQVL